jgi:hypothetical protein
MGVGCGVLFTCEQLAYCVGDASQAQHDKKDVGWWLREPQPH